MSSLLRTDLPLSQMLIDAIGLTSFSYLFVSAAIVMELSGPTSRISLLGFLIPHASKVLLWSAYSLLILRPRFGWRFPFSMLLLYCMAEMITNAVYVMVHGINFTELLGIIPNPTYYFILSNVFFTLGITLSLIFLKGRISFSFDWAILPWAVFISIWVLQGYVTESTTIFGTPKLEAYEVLWNVLYLLMMSYILRPKRKKDLLFQRPVAG